LTTLTAQNLRFGYSPQQSILDDWNGEFKSGRSYAIVGPSGSGKSSLMFLLGLMLTPTSGSLLLDGVATDTMRDRPRARMRANRYGFVFQDACLDPTRTVLDNILQPAAWRGVTRGTLVESAQQWVKRLEIDVPLNRRPGEVSGGQAQRIALARALLSSPDIVLADEPTGNLDSHSSKKVIDALLEHCASGSVLAIVTHDPAVAQQCDEIVTLGSVHGDPS